MAKIFGGLAGTAEAALRKQKEARDRKIAEATGETYVKESMVTSHEVIKKPKEKKNGGY